jgi:hypothetical protein
LRSGDVPNELGAIELLELPSRHDVVSVVCNDAIELCGVLCGHVLWTRRLGVPVLRSGNLPNELGAIELHELPSRHGVVGLVCIDVVELRGLRGRHVLWNRRVGVRVLRSGDLPIELGAIELLELSSRHVLDYYECGSVNKLRVVHRGLVSALDRPMELSRMQCRDVLWSNRCISIVCVHKLHPRHLIGVLGRLTIIRVRAMHEWLFRCSSWICLMLKLHSRNVFGRVGIFRMP